MGDKKSGFGNTTWKVGAGLAVGFAAVATGLLLSRGGRRLVREVWQGRTRTRLEDRILDRLWSDRRISRRRIDASEVSPGVIELSGAVRDERESDLAVQIARGVDGVQTVVNRLETETLESHLADNRRRYADGDPALHGSHWYGMEVGTGRRRQSRDTEPDRPDDSVDMITRDLDVSRAARFASEDVDEVGGARPDRGQAQSGGDGRG
ncbi:MAG: BON domain-containing protein [Longimicrobiales bacterium]